MPSIVEREREQIAEVDVICALPGFADDAHPTYYPGRVIAILPVGTLAEAVRRIAGTRVVRRSATSEEICELRSRASAIDPESRKIVGAPAIEAEQRSDTRLPIDDVEAG